MSGEGLFEDAAGEDDGVTGGILIEGDAFGGGLGKAQGRKQGHGGAIVQSGAGGGPGKALGGQKGCLLYTSRCV